MTSIVAPVRLLAALSAWVGLSLAAAAPALAEDPGAESDAMDGSESTMTKAEEDTDDDPWYGRDRFAIRGGYQWIFGSDTVFRKDSTIGGIGTAIDFDKTLGGDTDDSSWRLEGLWRIKPNHTVGFYWYRVNRDGKKTVAEEFEFDDKIFDVDGVVSSDLDIDLFRLLYNWSFYASDRVELAISPGIYIADAEFRVAGNLVYDDGADPGTAEPDVLKEDITVPLPSVGLLAEYRATDWLRFRLRADWFYLQIGDFEGYLSEFLVGPELRLHEHFGIGVAYDFLTVDAEDNSKNGWKVDNTWNALYCYGAIYF